MAVRVLDPRLEEPLAGGSIVACEDAAVVDDPQRALVGDGSRDVGAGPAVVPDDELVARFVLGQREVARGNQGVVIAKLRGVIEGLKAPMAPPPRIDEGVRAC